MNKLILFLFCTLLAWPLQGKDKALPLPVSMTVVVTPAYTPMLYRHQNHVVLTVTNWVDKPQSLRFRGAITGDNGFSAVTNPEFQPAISFVLLPFQTRSFVLANAPTVGFLDEANLDINLPKGMQEQLNQGLAPEGSYQLCVQALAYETGIALSDEACFSYNVAAAQPPLTLSPQCGDTVQQQFPVFNWSVPGGAFDPAKIRYDLYLLRLQPGQNDPWAALQQAIVSGVGNPLVKTGLYTPGYSLKPADAAFLGKGRYAWAVVARDISGLLYLDNGGMSNVCGFVYDFPPTTHQTGTGTNPPIATPKNTILKGRLFYTYLEGTVPPLPMNFTTTYSTAGTYQQELQNQRAWYGGTLVNSGTTGFTPDLAAELSAQKTAINNIFAYMPPIDKAYPLAGVRIKLELHLIRKSNKNDTRGMGAIVVNQAVGEGVTDAQGNFTIAFLSKDSLGQITKILNASGGGPYFVPVLKLLVLDKHFCSPELNIEVQPGGTTDIGNVVSFVRSYNLNIKATVSTTSVGGVVSPGQPIKSLQLKIGRYHNPDMAIPQDEIAHPLEGDGLKELGTGTIGATINGTYLPTDFDLMVFSKATTDDNGVAHFTRIAGVTEEVYVAKNPRGDTASMYSLGWGSNKFVPGFGFNSPMTGPAIFNRVYYGLGMPAFNHTITATLKSPIIKGRVFEEQLGNAIDKRYMAGVKVKLSITGGATQIYTTGSDGKFEFRSLPANASCQLEITKTGYGTVTKSNLVLNYGQLLDLFDINLKPAQRARGSVMDEYGKPLPCYVQTGNGTIYETGDFVDDYGKPYYGFDMYTSGDSLHLMPKSSAFFPKKFPLYFYAPPGKPAYPSWGVYTLYERRHRLNIVVKNEAKQPIPNAVVDLEEFSVRTDNNGVATFNFPSPGNQFYLQVSGLADYAATQKILTNNPSEQALVYEVVLSAAVRLNGFVTAGSNQTPLANAHLVVNSGGREFEAYTNAQGYYEIVGIPRTGSMTVSKESGRNQPLYIGQTLSSYAFTDPAKTVFSQNFNISVREDLAMSDIWGFKAEVTRVSQGSSSPVLLCIGAITQIPENENFRPKGDLKRVPFSNVPFEKTGQLDSMGRALIAPKGTQMNLSWSEWTVKLYDQYDATLKNVNGGAIQIQKKDGKGVIEGLVSTELEPFRFSYQYNGQFYLGESANDLFIPVFKAKEPYPYRPFHLMNGDAAGNPSDLAFKMRTFPATASRDSSFVSRDSGFVIRTVLHTNIPGITPSDLKLDIGKIAVTKKGIEIKKGTGNRNYPAAGGWHCTIA